MLPGEAIATRLKEFGFDVQFKPMEGSAFNDYFTKKEHTVIIEFAPTGNVFYIHIHMEHMKQFIDQDHF